MDFSYYENLCCPLSELPMYLSMFERLTDPYFECGKSKINSRWTLTVIYLKKFYDRNGLQYVPPHKIFLLVVVCYVLACKFLEDIIPDNRLFAHAFVLSRDPNCDVAAQKKAVSDILRVLNESELFVLQMLEYNLYVHPMVYQEYDTLMRRYESVLRMPFPTLEDLPYTQCEFNVVMEDYGGCDIRVYFSGSHDEQEPLIKRSHYDLEYTAHTLLCFEEIPAEYS